MTDNGMALAATARKRANDMTTVYPAQVEAWDALDVETRAALMAAVAACTAGESQDVRSHAAIVVAELFDRTPGDGAPRTLRAARKARKVARTAVTLAEVHRAEYAAGVTRGDFEENGVGEDMPAMAGSTAPAPDGIARTTYGDLCATALGMAGSEDLTAMALAYREHVIALEAGRPCEHCADTGAHPTLLNITAHRVGAKSTDSAYHRMRRTSVAALRTVPGSGEGKRMGAGDGAPALAAWDALAEYVGTGDAAPLATRPTRSSRLPAVTPVTRPGVGAVTVRTRDGEEYTRPMTEAEEAQYTAPRSGARAPEALDTHDGDGSTGPQSVDARGMVPAYGGMRRPETPRKAKRGGQTGPTVTGAPSALGMTGPGLTPAPVMGTAREEDGARPFDAAYAAHLDARHAAWVAESPATRG